MTLQLLRGRRRTFGESIPLDDSADSTTNADSLRVLPFKAGSTFDSKLGQNSARKNDGWRDLAQTGLSIPFLEPNMLESTRS